MPDRNGKIFYTSNASLSHISKGFGNVFALAEFEDFKGKTIGQYAEFSKKLSEYRDNNFGFKNYRVMDLVARMIVNIDYIGVLNYIEANGGKDYEDPTKVGLSADRVKELQFIKSSAQKAVKEVDKMARSIGDALGLSEWKPTRWSDGSGQRVRDYLWIKMHYSDFKNAVDSISIFVEKSIPDTPGREKTRLRISIEMVDENADEAAYNQHHRILELTPPDGLCYVVSGPNARDVIVTETPDVIKQKIANGTYKKVQLSKVIEFNPSFSNADYYNEMMSGAESLIPLYDYMIGKTTSYDYSDFSESDQNKENRNMQRAQAEIGKNTILYGPPGTGKTYNSAIYAVAICDGKTIDEVKEIPYAEVMNRYKELKAEGRIAFTTFHQSYGYEEFIEGIKPDLESESDDIRYSIKDGVFKTFCERASQKKIISDKQSIKTNASVWCVILGGTKNPELKQKCFEEGTIRIGWNMQPEIISEDTEDVNDKERRILLNFQDGIEIGDIIAVRSSGTGVDGIGIVTSDPEYDTLDEHFPRKRMVDWLYTGEEISIFDLNAETKLDRKTVYPLWRVDAGALLDRIPEKNGLEVESETRPYVFVIDEINRGNISKIFGELITLIEDTKRAGCDECVPALLPYSHSPFSVPVNVYLVGTMNTADRSIALIDTALRRRFDFVEMMPESAVLENIGGSAGVVNIGGIDLDVVAMLDAMNKRITVLYDREHTIGHAFFIPLMRNRSLKTLRNIFENKVIPLLQEYFYEDYSKIQLVLADNAKTSDDYKFILDSKVKIKETFKGNADEILNTDNELIEYTIQMDAFDRIQSYVEIYN